MYFVIEILRICYGEKNKRFVKFLVEENLR